ncbi:PIN domain-containing protein [Desulfobacterium sp. N47]|uniref:PIN domain-containing protein n=1 Tax=Desulfobacterium sp. N47 TaxID=3115210 RepID=UPI003C9CB78A
MLVRFREHSPQDVAISTITLFELQYGVEKSQFRQRSEDALVKFLLLLNLIDPDRSAAEEAAVIRAQLEKKGIPIGPYDLLIAGLALSQNLTLVTNNTREFERIVGLRLENWVDAQ